VSIEGTRPRRRSVSVVERAQSAAGGLPWIAIGRASDVPMLEGRSVEAAGRRIAVFRLPDGWAAIDHVCPHRGGPLADGIVADRCVTCPLHNQRFSLVSGAREDAPGPGVRAYPVRERDGLLELDPDRLAALPRADA
jgi:NAD(P)H-dependent nitrite reductase small subunit